MTDEWILGAYVSIIGRCNYKCIYCSANEQIETGKIMTVEEFKYIIEILSKKRLLKLNITGGEPFANPKIEEIIGVSINKFIVNILTNASLVEKHVDFLSKIEKKKNICFSVSLDSANEDVNELTRGIGAYRKTIEGIKLLVNLGYEVYILCTVTKYFDENELLDLVKLASTIGARSVRLTPLQPVGLAKKRFEELYPTIRKLNQLSRYIPVLEEKYGIGIGNAYGKCYNEGDQKVNLLSCKAGITQVSIRANGDVFPCNSLDIYMGNIFNEPIETILHESNGAKIINEIRNKTISEHYMCSRCSYNSNCTGGCRGVAYGYTGDYFAPSIYCDKLKKESNSI